MNTQKPHGDEIQSSMTPNDHVPSRRDFLVQSSRTVAGLGIAAVLGNLGTWALSWGADNEPIKVGVLHSLSGTMAISEVSLKDVVSMAVQEINAKGGVLGRQLKLVVVDPASNWDLFAEKAKQLLVQEKVAVV
ncbi:MAG TPA: transporter substrate-binding protein, partial [Nitrospira sp.]|nr:transporter substrate-binding protein [Nitrospira sp.]